MAITSTQQTDILKVVAGLFNAAPGGTNLSDLANAVSGGMTIKQLANVLASNTLFTNGIMAGKVTTDDQAAVLMNNFGLVADDTTTSAGSQALAYFKAQIDAKVSFGDIVYDAVTFLSTTTDAAFTTAATLLANKALVAASYSASNSSSDLSVLQNVVSTVTGTAPLTTAEVATIIAALSDAVAPVVTAPAGNFSFAENQAADATLATIAATDNTAVTGFEIASGNDSGFFAIDAAGKITLTTAGLTSAANDFETTPNSFTLGVKAIDSAGNKSAAVDVILDVTDADEAAPELTSQVLSGNKAILTFGEAFDAASIPAGSSFLVTESGTTNIAISAVTVSGQIVTLTLATTPTGTTTVSYTPPGSSPLQDAAGNDVVAFSNKTLTVDTTAPTLSSSTPADNATAVAIANNLVLTFSETVQAGTGNIVITNASDATDTRTIAVTDTTQVTFNGSTVTINPTADLKSSANYNVQIAATAVKDSAGNAYAGITNSTTLNFATLVSTGTTFVLTTSLENLTGTDNDDLFIGDNTSLTSDAINAGSGTDKLTITNAAAGTYTTVPTLTSIETLQVTDTGGGAATFNLTNSTGVKTIINSGSTSTNGVTFSNVAAIADLQINNTVGAVLQTVGYAAAAVAGTSDTQKVSLTAANMTGAGGLTVAGIETMAITAASGASTLLAITDAALTKVTVEGAGDLTITNALVGATTIDASLATGAVKVTADAVNVAFTGGSGNDTINMVATLASADTLNGNTGTDTLRLSNQTTFATSAQTNVTNFEALQIDALTAASATVDLSLYGATNVFKTITIGNTVANTGGFTTGSTLAITKGVTGSTINVDVGTTAATGTGTFALASDGTADTLTLALRDTDTGNVVSTNVLTSFTAATVEDLTITANRAVLSGTTFDAGDTLNVATISAAAATKLTLSGDSAISLGNTASTFTALATVDASTMTKNVTLGSTTTVFNTVNTGAAITTGSGDDSVSLDVGTTGVLKAIALGTNSTVTTTTGDTLTLKSASGTGSTIIDLSSTTDQISQLLGSVNSAAQTGIEHINLSTFDQTTATSQITGSAEINNITGADGVDTINAGAGNDVITGGLGADSMSGSSGADTFRFGLLADVTLGTPDTVGDFVQAAGGDILSFNANGAGSFAIVSGTSTADQVINGFEVVAGAAHSPNSEISIITTAVAGALTSANAATAIGSATGAYAATDFKLFVVSNGTDAAVFYFDSAAADATVIAAELGAGPIITLTGIDSTELAALVAGNFSFSA